MHCDNGSIKYTNITIEISVRLTVSIGAQNKSTSVHSVEALEYTGNIAVLYYQIKMHKLDNIKKNFKNIIRIGLRTSEVKMTVAYSLNLSSYKGFGSFWKLLFRWRGSVYKLVWRDLVVYTILYYFVSAIYRFALDEEHKRVFENVALQTNRYSNMIPVAFLLGFYVTLVVQRWWDQFELFAWIDSLSFLVSIYILGDGMEERLIRKTILRYVNLGATMTLIEKSPLIAKRFPTLNHLIDFVVDKALVKGKVRDSITARALIEEIGKLRGKCHTVLTYDIIDIPLVYTQVVTLAVYCYFASSLLSRQFLDPKMNYDDYKVDLYVPIITYLQFFFYMGWLKVSNMLADDGCREWPSCVHDTNNGLKDPIVLNQLYKKEPATIMKTKK
ncbi:hypothetical protein Anas_03436 [Armadillidium nasatum]|uniref:Bestrophin homolog n=1 Tax=Armadillidium nasatum TaxID=96803 RepID=A0A5N5SZH2_9CRUS|nr:hypothetical protein Anas_03436 [Armadillidium nasatum]